MMTIPAVFDMLFILSPIKWSWPVHDCSAVEFAAAHKKVAIGIGADVFAFLVEQFRIADRTIVPPVFFRLVFEWQCL
jgi:hypothetical protein